MDEVGRSDEGAGRDKLSKAAAKAATARWDVKIRPPYGNEAAELRRARRGGRLWVWARTGMWWGVYV